jgi:Ala-tRNA(Pro) deacylase
MFETETQVLRFLDMHQIPYQRLEHPPIYTCEEEERLWLISQGVNTKNLFLGD